MHSSGNRCGHNPTAPRLFSAPSHHLRPRILSRLIQRLENYYHHPRTTLPSLDLANGSDRQQRSERREACVALLGCLIHYTDLATLRVGIPQPDGSFQGLTMGFLAGVSGLGLRRAERAIHDLAVAGLVSVHPIAQRLEDCTYKGLAAIRAVSKRLFEAFGMGKWLRHEREKATRRLEKKLKKNRSKLELLLEQHQALISQKKPDRSSAPCDQPSAQVFRPRHICEAAKAFFAAARALKGKGPP